MTDFYDYLSASNGSGDAALMHITAPRSIASTTIDVDSVANVPAKFIGTCGTILPSGFIDPTTKQDFRGHVDGSTLVIDAFAPGSVDAGNTEGQVVFIKPTTYWADLVAAFIQNITNHGTPAPATVSTLSTTGAATFGGATTFINNDIAANELATNAITLGYAQITSPFTSTAINTATDITGLSTTVTIPAGSRRIEVSVGGYYITSNTVTTAAFLELFIVDVTAGATLGGNGQTIEAANHALSVAFSTSHVPSAGSRTYKVQFRANGAGTFLLQADATTPAFILVKAI